MVIKHKTVIVYDIEIFYNVFTCTCFNTETKEVIVFEISRRKNDLNELIGLFSNSNYMFCGYNNKHYDDVIINLILRDKNIISSFTYDKLCKGLYKFSKGIISEQQPAGYKELKYAKYFSSFDLLTMLFSQKLRVGLKEMQVTMQYPNVQEFEGDFDSSLPDEEIDKMLKYNLNDVMSTNELLNRCIAAIELRLGIEEEYG